MNNENGHAVQNVCDISYLSEMVHGNKNLIREIMDEFLIQIFAELQSINDAVEKVNYQIIKNIAHSMKSSVSIMGVSILTPVLQEMEDLGLKSGDIEKIKKLNIILNLICKEVVQEIESIKHKYI